MLALTIEEWSHEFAAEFYNIFVDFELDTFHQRVTPESELFDLAYDNAVSSIDEFHFTSPVEAAKIVFERMKH